ncbi:uncharacterized protein [Littorina saxatilis]|uniref:uncharacterized protein n=1 Tax=Littorina saxatilis TaxID=31220 RepID=UPI0038B50E15
MLVLTVFLCLFCGLANGKELITYDVCSDLDGSQSQSQPGFCKVDDQLMGADCSETEAFQCPQGSFLPEGSVCLDHSRIGVVFTCRAGVWVTDWSGHVLVREKRFFGLFAAFVGAFAGCVLFCGRGGSSTQREPNRPPEFLFCPTDLLVVAEQGETTANVSWPEPTARDPEREAIRVQQLTGGAPGSEFSRGSHSVKYMVRDSQGSADYCSFNVTVQVKECPEPPPVTDGHQECRPLGFIYGTVCHYTCDTGYKLKNGISQTECGSNGTWSHEFPACEPIQCGTPREVTGGQAVCDSFEYGALCPIQCQPGFRPDRDCPFIRCTANGNWTQSLPCIDVQAPTFESCPPNQDLRSGPLLAPVTLNFDDPVVKDNSGLAVKLRSNKNKGDNLDVGTHVIGLYATDKADNSASCFFVVNVTAAFCYPPLTPSNGRITCTHCHLQGSQCTVTCSLGYQLLGTATLTCMDENEWDNAVPTCEPIQCSEPPRVEYGHYNCNNDQTYRDTCSLDCQPTFGLTGPSYITCLENGTWSGAGSCEDNTPPVFNGCPDNVDVPAARLGEQTHVTWEHPSVEDNTGKNVTLTGDKQPGSEFPLGVTWVKYTAVDTNNNEAICQFTVTVTTLSCDAPQLRQNATDDLMVYTCLNGYAHGAVCTLSCKHGFPLDGAGSITCERDDSTYFATMSWEFDEEEGEPECKTSHCPVLITPTNGALACYDGNFGRECIMSCVSGWDLPASFDGRFYCPYNQGFWITAIVPNCTVRVLPGQIRLMPDLYYYTNSTGEATEQLKQNLINILLNSQWGEACSQTPSCKAENVQVTFGRVRSRRKRALGNQPTTSYYIRISFEIVIDYNETNTTASGLYQKTETIRQQVYDKLKDDASSGRLDFGSLTTHEHSVGFPQLVANCPTGTVFKEKHGANAISCVGCSTGHYLSEDGQCRQCEVGSFSEVDNATSCYRCPVGWSTPTNGSTSSSDCEEVCLAGTFSPRGFAPCQPCPPGQYQSHDGATSCDLCPSSTWTNGGASSFEQCVPADAHLSLNDTVTAYTTEPLSPLMLTCFINLSNTSTVNVNLTFNDSSYNPHLISLHSKVGPDSSQTDSPDVVTGVSGQNVWTRLEMEVDTSSGQIIISYGGSLIYNHSLQSQSSVPSFEVTISPTEGRAIVSGLYAAESLDVMKDIATECSGQRSTNKLAWIVPPRAVQSPSVCDPVNECASSPCSSHGVCVDQRGDYLCQCQDGWTGDTCHLPPGACYLHQCQNAATCVPGDDNYTCVCVDGFSGKHCELIKVHGEFGEWQPWSNCSASCEGHQQRQRLCNNPPPLNDGDNCSGEFTQTQTCGTPQCPVHGQWSTWAEWSECSAECGGGERTRTRECNNPTPQAGGDRCDWSSLEINTCNAHACPVNGAWNNWSEWTPCSVTCGNGIRSRDRSCDSPVPANGGTRCTGDANETAICHPGECPVCSEIIRSAGTFLTCEEKSSPYLKTCNLTCVPSYLSSEEFPLYRCGEMTGHLWNGQSDRTTPFRLPSCSTPQIPPAAEMTQYVPLKSGCDIDKNILIVEVTQNLKKLPCVDNGCDVVVEVNCVHQNASRRKRNVEQLQLAVTLRVDFEPILSSSGDINDTIRKYTDLLYSAEETGALMTKNKTEELYTITAKDNIIKPDVEEATFSASFVCTSGFIAVAGQCVPCAAGSMEEGGQCVLCPVGQYQDTPGSVSCKPCPEGLAWDLPGASRVDQCVYPFNGSANNTPSSTTFLAPISDNDATDPTDVIVGVVAAVLMVMLLSMFLGLLWWKTRCRTYFVEKVLRKGKGQEGGTITPMNNLKTLKT